MSSKLARPRVAPYAGYLLVVLAGLLVYAYIPMRFGRSSDPVAQQVASLRRGSASQRSSAVTELARLAGKDPARVLPDLTEALQDSGPEVRLAAVNALHVVTPGAPQATQAATALVPRLQDDDPRVRAAAAGILSTLKPDLKLVVQPLLSAALPEPERRPPALRLLRPQPSLSPGRNSSSAACAIMPAPGAVAALSVLGPHDPEVLKTLVSLADDRVPEVRMVAARVLGEIGPEAAGAFAALRKLTTDPDLYIQARAITSLGSFPGDHVASCPLFYRAYLSKERPLQEGAELSLAKITKSKQFNASEARQSKGAAMRFTAVFALNPNSDAGFKLIEQSLKDEDSGVRIMAGAKLAAVSSSRHEEAVKALKSLANDKDEEVRQPDASLAASPVAEASKVMPRCSAHWSFRRPMERYAVSHSACLRRRAMDMSTGMPIASRPFSSIPICT